MLVMKKIQLLFVYLLLLMHHAGAQRLMGSSLNAGSAAAATAGSPATGITIAGGNGPGAAANQLSSPTGVFVDASGNLYVADVSNYRIQKWAPGATAGITVAGGNGDGSASNQLSTPLSLYVTPSGDIYIADQRNDRIQKWSPGASAGVTVAGGNGRGNAANQLNLPGDVTVDAGGNVYIADSWNNRIQKWAPGATTGVTAIAGGAGNYPMSLPTALFLDASGNIYIADGYNRRIQKWAPGATTGVIVAGGNGSGANQMGIPYDVVVDASGNVYVSDQDNQRIQKWTPGATAGITVAGGNGAGSTANQFNRPDGIYVDATGNIYVADIDNHRIQKFAQNGLTYRYYEGAFTSLPNFNTLTPVTTGISPNIDISLRTPGRNDNFAFVWEGYINIPAPGNYTFETISDDGSKLYFNSLYNPLAIPTVNNDGVHAPGSVTGTVYVAAAGTYPITITFFEKEGGEQMQAFWSGPGIARQPITGSAFIQTPPPSKGLTYRYYEGSWNTLPDFSTLSPVKTGTSPNIDINVRPAGRNDNFAFVWEGYITINKPGVYTFETVSDDGSRLYFNSLYLPSATAIVNNDGVHPPASATGSVNIAVTGAYPVSFTFFEKEGGEQMQVYWTGPGIARQQIPDSVFTQTPPPSQGLSYKYYQGSFSSSPAFGSLTPDKTGTSSNVDISVRPAGRNDDFAFIWQGAIYIPKAGTYTFETISDDGSNLYFNTLYNYAATPTVNNDGIHPPTSATGTVNVPLPGIYLISITFFEHTGGEQMEVYWAGPGIARQRIPDWAFASTHEFVPPTTPWYPRALYTGKGFVHMDWDNSSDNTGLAGYEVRVQNNDAVIIANHFCTESAFTVDSLMPNTNYHITVRAIDRAGNYSDEIEALDNYVQAKTTNAANGLNYRYYEGAWNSLPNFNTLTPVKSGLSPNADINVRNAGVNDNFGFVWEGYINIPAPGAYTFETVSDDGSKLYFNSFYVPGATALVNNDGVHAPGSATGTVNVPAAGLYPISITFFEKEGGEQMQLYWSGPGFARQRIPDAAFRDAGTIADAYTQPGADEAKSNGLSDPGKIVISKIYPDPFTDRFNISLFNASAANNISVSVSDLKGRKVFTHNAGNVAAGNNTLVIPLNGAHLAGGMYLVTLHVNGIAYKTMPLLKAK